MEDWVYEQQGYMKEKVYSISISDLHNIKLTHVMSMQM